MGSEPGARGGFIAIPRYTRALAGAGRTTQHFARSKEAREAIDEGADAT